MISLVLQHLENLQLDLTAIDPANRFDAADKVAAMASELRRAAMEASGFDDGVYDGEHQFINLAPTRKH